MLFNTLAYAAFFAIVFVVSWLLRALPKVRVWFLLAASYFFYAQWDLRFLPLIWASSTLDFWLARQIHAAAPHHRKRWLTITVIVNLGVLAFFKYAGFGVDQLRALLTSLDVDATQLHLEVALPVGISFFTFESMSYVIDVYRGELEPHDSYIEYLTFVAFFPHLVAGPIVRPRDLLPQLARSPVWQDGWGSEGLFLIAIGLTKKIAIGDYLAVNLVDRVFDAPLMYSGLEVYAAIVGYALQIYCDFSGYTDIAIGSALLLGVRFPLNFDSPYKAANIAEFWRRWHISLSTWLRDYLYIPLGGNRKGRLRTYVNLLITMILGGFWHGAAWTFLLWGALHGLALAIHRAWTEQRGPRPPRPLLHPLHVLSVLFTFHVVLIGWVYFRAPSFATASALFQRLATLSTYHPNLPPPVLGVLAAGLFSHFVPNPVFEACKRRFIALPFPAQGAVLFACMVLLRRMAQADAVPFVYFQF